MKVAVASDNAVGIAEHFGRSRCFIIFELQDGVIKGTETRANRHTAFARGECPGDEHEPHAHNHDHAGVVGLLRDCEAILCRGMGWRAAEELKAKGIRPLMVAAPLSAEQAVLAYASGTLEVSGESCGCRG
jgi:predicted Fe-Mo cluster-binding NifX family protein